MNRFDFLCRHQLGALHRVRPWRPHVPRSRGYRPSAALRVRRPTRGDPDCIAGRRPASNPTSRSHRRPIPRARRGPALRPAFDFVDTGVERGVHSCRSSKSRWLPTIAGISFDGRFGAQTRQRLEARARRHVEPGDACAMHDRFADRMFGSRLERRGHRQHALRRRTSRPSTSVTVMRP